MVKFIRLVTKKYNHFAINLLHPISISRSRETTLLFLLKLKDAEPSHFSMCAATDNLRIRFCVFVTD